MAKSLGGAMAEKIPVVIHGQEPGRLPEIFYKPGDEAAALELLEKVGVLKRVFYESSCPSGCLEVKGQ